MTAPLLDVRHLRIEFVSEHKPLIAVDDVSFTLERGETLGLVGESGCGKTTTILGILRLLAPGGRITGGEVLLDGTDILDLSMRAMRELRWKRIAIVFQSAMNALNPVRTIGAQISETIALHQRDLKTRAVKERIGELLELVGIPAQRQADYPHQFSGGMRQRAMIAIALSCNPDILIADEPTTAIDVMIQAQILELLQELKTRLGMSMILVTHDLGVVAEVCDRVVVMYGGVVAEQADVRMLFNSPRHPYTQLLLEASPDIKVQHQRLRSIPGFPPRLDDLPPGCRFQPRCPFAFEPCAVRRPPLYRAGPNHSASCFLLDAALTPNEVVARG